MPVKPLPKKLVQKLRKYAKVGILSTTSLGRMKNIDPEREGCSAPPTSTERSYRRVREMNVHRQFPGV